MKKLGLPLLFALVLLLLPQVAAAAEAPQEPIQLFLDGERLHPEVPPLKIGETSMVPVRIISESLGAEVGWDGELRKVSVLKGETSIELLIDNKKAKVNGELVQLERAPVIIAGNTLLPVRFLAETLGLQVDWDDATRSVHLTSPVPDSGQPGGAAPGGNSDGSGTDAGSGTKGGTGTEGGSGADGEAGTGKHPGSIDDDGSVPAVTQPEPPEPPQKIIGSKPKGKVLPVPAPGDADGGQAPPADPPAAADKPALVSITVDGERVVIEATETADLQPTLFYLQNPDRLVIDLPGVALGNLVSPNRPAGEIVPDHPDLEKVRYALHSAETQTVRIVIDMKRKLGYKLEQTKANHLVVTLQDIQAVVVLDAGHGGHDPGAISVNNRKEKDFNLAMTLKIKEYLEQVKGVDVHLTRADDTYLTLDERVEFANNLAADLFVSVHGNKFTTNVISGTETYYWRPESKELAEILHRQVVSAAGFPDRKVRTAEFRVIKYTTMPAVLLEIGYLSNPSDEANMYDPTFQSAVAKAIADGILQYLSIS